MSFKEELMQAKAKTKVGKTEAPHKKLFRKTNYSKMQLPKKLFGSLWAQNELAILFAEDGAGKSILSVQCGCAIAGGQSVHHLFPVEVEAQPVAYIDAELSDYQFYNRYPNALPDNFNRFAFDEASALSGATIEYVIEQVEAAANECNSKIIILDNLSALCSMADLTKTSDSIQLMGLLNELKKKGFSILVIDHPRKPMREGDFKIISKHDLQGSKMKSNLADSVFTIGKSIQNERLRYIKGLKVRSFDSAFTTKGVATMELNTNPLRLDFVGINYEFEHVNERKAEVQKLAAEGVTQTKIAEKMGVSQQAVSKMLNDEVPF